MAYHAGLAAVHRLIAQWEVELNEKACILYVDFEEWWDLVLDPSHSWGHASPYKQTLRLYWMMKILLMKAREHIPSGSITQATRVLDYSQYFQQLKFQLQ